LSNLQLADALATTYGLTHDSILNSLQFFHITEGLPPDIMHDILEGGLQYEVKEMLQVFTEEKGYFTLDTLNKVIEEFKYGYTDSKDKPASISLSSSDHSIAQEGQSSHYLSEWPRFQCPFLHSYSCSDVVPCSSSTRHDR